MATGVRNAQIRFTDFIAMMEHTIARTGTKYAGVELLKSSDTRQLHCLLAV